MEPKNFNSPLGPVRALLIGLLLSAFSGFANVYNTMVIRGSLMDLDFSTPAAVFLLFVLIGFVNPVLRKVCPRKTLSGTELVIIYGMLITSCAVSTMGLTMYLLPMMAGVSYYASPVNRWSELIQPYVKPWMAVRDHNAVTWFFEGMPKGTPMPLDAWVKPFAFWAVFVLALYFGMICLASILRRQWVERERLVFPLTELPFEMMREEGRVFPPLLRNRLMWFGFAIPFLLGTIVALHRYFPLMPAPRMVSYVPIFRNTNVLVLRLSFPMVGFTYLISTKLAASLWGFFLLQKLLRGYFDIAGIGLQENLDSYSVYGGGPVFSHIQLGALIFLVIFGFWTGREYYVRVLKKSFGRDDGIDDSGEMCTYRFAVLGLAVSFLVMALWLSFAGMSFGVAMLFLLLAGITFTGISRVVAEGGVAETRAPLVPSTAVVSGLGSSFLGPNNMVVLGYTHAWAADIRTFVLNSVMHLFKLSDSLKGKRKLLFPAVGLALAITLASSVWTALYLAYKYGGINSSGDFFIYPPRLAFGFVAEALQHPGHAFIPGLWLTGLGALVMCVLFFLHHTFLWWPLHPLGFAVCGIFLTDQVWLSIFISWLVKSFILRYGGARIYERSKFFFLGLILGQFTVSGLWLVIDFFTGMCDNSLFWV